MINNQKSNIKLNLFIKKRSTKMKKLFSLIILIAFAATMQAQGHKPFRIGAKIGTPNLLGVGAEYAIMDHIAPNFDFSYIPLSLDDNTDLSFTFIGGGANYYLDKNNKGVYGGLGIGYMSLGVTETGVLNPKTFDNDGTGDFSIGAMLVIAKVGYRWMWGAFTVTPEIGYALGSVDNSVTYTATFPDGSTAEETYDTSDIPVSSGPVYSVAIGIAF